jgi:hypothetical protein
MWDDGAWTNRRKWYESEDQYVRRQRSEVEERAEASDARLRHSLRQVTEQKDALVRQVADLGSAFDAFVELTGVREELAVFVAGPAARERARATLSALLAAAASQTTYTAADARAADARAVAGYWLPAAVAGLEAVAREDRQAGEPALAAAAGIDEQRTALFLALALPLVGAPESAVAWLPRALGPSLPPVGAKVVAAVRELWRLSARAVYGEPGRAAVVAWLSAADDTDAAAELNKLIGRRPSSSSDDEAEARFSRARAAVASLTDLGRKFSVEPPVVPGRRLPEEEPSDLVETTVAPSLTLLEALIAEGSPDEADLIHRAQMLSDEVRRYRSREDAAPTPRWDAPTDTLLALLLSDLQETSASDAGLRELAQRALRRTAATLAEQLLAEACAELPETLIMQLDGQGLELRVNDPLDPQMAALDEAADRRYAPEAGRAGRKQAAEAAQRSADRKARNRREAQAVLDRLSRLQERLPGLRQEAQTQYSDLLARLGQLAERESVA